MKRATDKTRGPHIVKVWLANIASGQESLTSAAPVGTLQAMRAVTLRNVFAYVLSQHFVDQRLVSDAATARFLAELIEHARIDTDRDQLARFVAERRPTHPPHGLQLLGRRIGNGREVDLSHGTPHVRGDSPAAR